MSRQPCPANCVKPGYKELGSFLLMSRGSFLSIPPFSKQRARKKGQAPPHTELPPKLLSFRHLKVEFVRHGFAGSLSPGEGSLVVALKLVGCVRAVLAAAHVVRRGVRSTAASLFLRIESPLNLYISHGARDRPLHRRCDSYGRQTNPAGQHHICQKSMQVHASHLQHGTNIRKGVLLFKIWRKTYQKTMVRKEGFEPPRPFGHKILSLARLPVPPLPQWF